MKPIFLPRTAKYIRSKATADSERSRVDGDEQGRRYFLIGGGGGVLLGSFSSY